MESCIIEDNVGNVVEMTLPSSVFSNSAIINSLPQVPVPLSSAGTNMVSAGGSGSYQLAVSLPTVPVASMQNQSQQIQVKLNFIKVYGNTKNIRKRGDFKKPD